MQKSDIIYSNGHEKVVEELPEERHTEDIQEIITKVPSWILRWGIMVFFGILLMIVAISAFVRYPDTVKGVLKLQSTGISVPVVATAPGVLSKVFVKQGTAVKRGQPLAEVQGNTTTTLTAPQDGKVGFVTIVEQGTVLRPGQEVFIIHPENEQFFGIMAMPAAGINKIKIGQRVLISLKNFPAEDYGQLKGTINYIADEPAQNGFFIIKVSLNTSSLKHSIALKDWMTADAEIITEDVSIKSRILKSIFKKL